MTDGASRRRVEIQRQLEYLVYQPTAPGGPLRWLNQALEAVAARPVLLRVGGRAVDAYSALFALGIGAGTLTWLWLLQYRLGYAPPPAAVVVIVVPVGVCGAYALNLLERAWTRRSGAKQVKVSGFSFYGAIFGILVLLAAAAEDASRLLHWLDTAAVAMLVVYGVGKFGCLAVGCCAGRPTLGRLGVTYSVPRTQPVDVLGLKGVRLVPVQMFETVLALTVVLALLSLPNAAFGTGMILGVYLLLFSLGRVALRPLRYRPPGERVGTRASLATHAVGVLSGLALTTMGAARGGVPEPTVAATPSAAYLVVASLVNFALSFALLSVANLTAARRSGYSLGAHRACSSHNKS